MSENDSHNQSSSEPSPDWKGPPILALVIGINKYINESCLQFAVGDANTFEQFLTERLNVPDANIISLRDEQASRAAILSAFISLKDNAKYQKNEAAIVIYYAGHGAQTDKPENWQDWVTDSERIEMLCPSDIGCTMSVNGEDVIVQGIPDRTISVLLNRISDVKGNNITLILDCCCSAGIDRGEDFEESEEYVIRRISNPPQLKNGTDKKLWSDGTRSSNIANGFSGRFHASHVLLAACGRDQVAYERPKVKQGVFTYSLMKVLNNSKNDINTLTYNSLMHKMEMPPRQTPHYDGKGVYRRLFNNHVPGADSSFILAKREPSGMSLVLEAGTALSITVGSRVAVHASNLLETPGRLNPRLGYLTVTSVSPFASVLKIPSNIRYPKLFYYCLIECSQKIALYCEDGRWLETLFPPEEYNQSAIIVDDVQSCDLQLTAIDGKVYFDRHHMLVAPHIGARISHTIDVGNAPAIQKVVESSLCFYHHLTRTGNDDFPNVSMELKELKEELSNDHDLDQFFTPIGNNLIANEPATIVVDIFASLGMTIFNQTELPLYPYLFYFDPTDLTIDEWYTPQSGAGPSHLTNRVDVPLQPKSRLTLGYGNGGVPPWQFSFREGDKKDIGFFKLFLSTCPTPFSSILQQSPFDLEIGTSRSDDPSPFDIEIGTSRSDGPGPFDLKIGMSRCGNTDDPDAPIAGRWATKLATIIQVDS